jgi:hypothetical protein
MADPTFKYPNTTAPTTTIEFARGGFVDDVPDVNSLQDSDESDYGEILTRSRGTGYYETYPFTFIVPIADQGGNTADVLKITTFVKTTVAFSARPFYYTPRDSSTPIKVKIINNSIWKTNYPTYREGYLLLRKVD